MNWGEIWDAFKYELSIIFLMILVLILFFLFLTLSNVLKIDGGLAI